MRPQNRNLKRTAGPGRPRGLPNKATREVKELARKLLENPTYQDSLRKRLITGKAPHMESLLWHYAFGRPKDSLVVSGKHGESIPVQIYIPSNGRDER